MPLFVQVLQTSFESLWVSVLEFLPRFLGAVVVFVVGLVVASVLKRVVIKIVELLHVDELAVKFEVTSALRKTGVPFNVGALLGWIVKWFFIVVFLIASTDILGWDQITSYLKEVVLFLPNVIIAAVMLIAGILLANFVRNLVHAAMTAAKLESANFVAGIVKWAIFLFTLMAALVQLSIAPQLISILFQGLVYMLALAGGLAFGLGGKEHASKFIERLRKDISQ
ncbi:MAG: TM helix protein [uncultured bacterium]|nr:MAG: TM helix protein [uncultured bacterium]HBD05632.1 hypothetical protein [Candidatus Uhrbacteria bacterium]